MKNEILTQLQKNGIYINDSFFSNIEKDNLKKDFSKNVEHLKFYINNFEEVKQISNTLYNFLNRDYIQYILTNYLDGTPKCSVILFSETKPQIKKDDLTNISEGSLLGFHNDDSGKQIKINILLNDLDKNSNGLEYAVSSHRISFLDKFLLRILKLFGFYKNWDKHLINYQKNKILGKKTNFMPEKKVKNKFKISKVHGLSGLVYIFDTNGFHRQGSISQKGNLSFSRKLITVYFDKKKN